LCREIVPGSDLAAGSIIVSIPVVVLFLYLQKYLVSGLTAGSVKG
jgi:arabinogalactan oligomer/maltooligosaccharide transport system permease protein